MVALGLLLACGGDDETLDLDGGPGDAGAPLDAGDGRGDAAMDGAGPDGGNTDLDAGEDAGDLDAGDLDAGDGGSDADAGVGDPVIAVSAGAQSILAIRQSGVVLGWGANTYSPMGDVGNPATPTTLVVAGVTAASISRSGHALYRLDDGTVRAMGNNATCQLGNDPPACGSAHNSNFPVTVVGPTGAPLSNVVAVSTGHSHSVALTASGEVYSWGAMAYGVAGNGEGLSFMTPPSGRAVRASLTDVVQVAAGQQCTFALRTDGTVWAWGRGDASSCRLGDGATMNRASPIEVRRPDGTPLTGVSRIAVGQGHAVAVLTTGAVVAWGLGNMGQIGDGFDLQRLFATSVQGLTDARDVVAGQSFSVALTADGGAWAWGQGNTRQLGDGSASNRNVPVRVVLDAEGTPLLGVARFAAGGGHVVALLDDGSLWGWGDNGRNLIGVSGAHSYPRAIVHALP